MPGTNRGADKKRELRHHKTIAEDERGWAGQRGQRPASQEEKNYQPHNGPRAPAPRHK
ncbi:MAG: hypothetical protein ACREFR_14700 [Limisphaerales bacterium]